MLTMSEFDRVLTNSMRNFSIAQQKRKRNSEKAKIIKLTVIMTKKTGNQESDYDHVSVEATHLVNEVLEEACIIVNTANESNDPWKYISCLKNYKNQDDAYDHNLTFVINKGCLKNLELDHTIITSTPQKGQGDEEIKLVNDNNTSNSTSIYISQLFDIADLEAADEEKDIEEIKESDRSILEEVIKIIDHCLDISVSKLLTPERNDSDFEDFVKENSNQSSQLKPEYVNEDIETNGSIDVNIQINLTRNCDEASAAEDKKINEKICLEDLCSYENAYLSLNRDDEQDFDTSELKLQDPRKITLQEVDLTPEQDVVKKVGQVNLEIPTSSKNADLLTDSRKRTLIYRCRLQSRKVLARLRSWLWRKSMRKYKVSRGWTGAERGMSPLSPRVKRRASSVFNHWPSRATFSRSTWKFNTISGTFVNSALWKELGSKVQFRYS